MNAPHEPVTRSPTSNVLPGPTSTTTPRPAARITCNIYLISSRATKFAKKENLTYLTNFHRWQITPHIPDKSPHGRIERQPSALNQSFAFSWLKFRPRSGFSAKSVRLDVRKRPRVQHDSLIMRHGRLSVL